MFVNAILAFVLFILFQPQCSSMSLLDISADSLHISFQNEDILAEKKQLQELDNLITSCKKRSDDFTKTVNIKLNKINTEITEFKNKSTIATGSMADALSKKITLLNDRKQNSETMQELWKDFLEKLEQRKKLLSEILTNLQNPHKFNYKSIYTWKEFRDAQLKATEAFHKIEQERNRRESLKKQKFAEKETLDSILKQIDVKNKEKDKVISQSENKQEKDSIKKSSASITIEGDVIDQELLLLNEKAEYYQLKVEKFEQEELLQENEIDLLQKKLNIQKEFLAIVERRLVIDLNDVEIAKSEWTSSTSKSSLLKDELSGQIEPKKYEKEKLALDLDYLNERLKKIRDAGKKDYAASAVTKSEIHKITNQLSLFESEIKHLEAKKNLANLFMRDKELQYIMVDLRYKLQRLPEKVDLEEQLANFKNQKDLEQATLKSFKDQLVEAAATIVESAREIETIKAKENKLKNKKIAFFRNSPNSLQETLSNYLQSRKILIDQLGVAQSFLAVNQELILSQEKILNRLELIVADIEGRYLQLSMWRRSPKAISMNALWKSFLSAEVFFKRLFWQTPEHLSPSVILSGIKNSTANDYIILFFCLIFFILAFIGFKQLFLFAQKRILVFLELYQQQRRLLYLNIVAAFINFAVDHFTLLFTWMFIYLHIFFNFKYIFSALRFLAAPYFQAMFYMLSIPILIYLSHNFLESLRALNQKLSYILFAEKFQNKFLQLLTIVFYASTILLPLRKAFLCYPDMPWDFAIVVMAAYSLILVIIFLLFFSKDDVLKLIPSNSAFFIWLERKIEKYYYPVFFFFMGLLILSNPYVGYSNMAWFLLFAAPTSVALIYSLFLVHHYLRKYAVFMFMKEEDEELIDKFEHAKAYYGFFVIMSFLILFLATFFLFARIWGVQYSPADIWKSLSETWAIPFGNGNKFGFIQFITVIMFTLAGFFASSLVNKFILNKLFDILRSEPGIQNTIARITHYSIIALAIALGFISIHLSETITYIGAGVLLAIGWASKDFVSDLIAGFVVLIERPLEIGNYVKIDNIEGTVHKIAARATTIITSRNHSIVIPNKDLINKFIDNWSYSKFAVGFEVYIRVDHKSEPELVKKLLLTVLQTNPAVLKVPNVVVRLEDIEPDAFYFLTRAFISTRRIKEQWELAAALRTEIIKTFRAHNIHLAKPQRVLGMHGDGDAELHKSVEIKFGK